MGFKQQSFKSHNALTEFMNAGYGIFNATVHYDVEAREDYPWSLSYWAFDDCENAWDGPKGPMLLSMSERGSTDNPWWMDLDAAGAVSTNAVPPVGTNPGLINATYTATVGRAWILGGMAGATSNVVDRYEISVQCHSVTAATLQCYVINSHATLVDEDLTAAEREAALTADIASGAILPIGHLIGTPNGAAGEDVTWSISGINARRAVGFVFITPVAPLTTQSFEVGVIALPSELAVSAGMVPTSATNVLSTGLRTQWECVTGTGTEILPPIGTDPGFLDVGAYTCDGGKDFYFMPERTSPNPYVGAAIFIEGTHDGVAPGSVTCEGIFSDGTVDTSYDIIAAADADAEALLLGEDFKRYVGVRFTSASLAGDDAVTCMVLLSTDAELLADSMS